MSNGKGQNSIIFLATLGVYLGLVLAGGAAPQVYAHAAITRNFEIHEEIEVKDDLDDDPNGCEALESKVRERRGLFEFDNESLFNYISDLRSVLSNAQGLGVNSVNISWASHGDRSPLNYVLSSSNSGPLLLNGKARRSLDSSVGSLAKIFPDVVEDGNGFGFGLSLDSKQIETTAKLQRSSDIDAHRAFVAYDASLDYWRCAAANPSVKSLLTHTSVDWSNNQVLIVTRLARASIDSLFATIAK